MPSTCAAEIDVGDTDAAASASATDAPIIERSAGRAIISKLTIELTGLPGSPKIGVPLDRAEGERLGRLDGDLHPVHVGDPTEHGLHHVVVAHADPAARDDRVTASGGLAQRRLERVLVVADRAEVDDVAAGLVEHRGEHRPVALADLSGLQR